MRSMALAVMKTAPEVRSWLLDRGRAGEEVALVPTMGALHAGHLALITEASRRAPRVAVSLFVNPTQFGPQEDLSRYPRDLEADIRRCSEAGAHLLFTPEISDMYPPGYQTFVTVEGLSQSFEGAVRPVHFRGVATIVTQLLSLFRPAIAVFGEKDYQQLQIIRRLNRDLHLRVNVVGVPTVREPDGLAMSSRNVYLAPEERQRAVSLSRGLFLAQRAAEQGELRVSALVGLVQEQLRAADAKEDYVALVDAETLLPLEALDGRPARLLVAARVGKTRLLDNVGIQGRGHA